MSQLLIHLSNPLKRAACLFGHGIDGILVLELEGFGSLVAVEAGAVEGKTDRAGSLAGTLAVGIKNFTQLGAGLNLEVNFCVILYNKIS